MRAENTVIGQACVELPNEAATVELASRLARVARRGDVLALWGGLGIGKTVFARAFVRTRCGPTQEVPSPTFTLVQSYESLPPFAGEIHHFDLYRLTAAEEAYALGIEEAFADGISLIEWPDRLEALLPARRLDVVLRRGNTPEARRVSLTGGGDWRQRLCEAGLA
jgi:tRNA threonylcarbamoyladenosine biosynthesis protein TsaE